MVDGTDEPLERLYWRLNGCPTVTGLAEEVKGRETGYPVTV